MRTAAARRGVDIGARSGGCGGWREPKRAGGAKLPWRPRMPRLHCTLHTTRRDTGQPRGGQWRVASPISDATSSAGAVTQPRGTAVRRQEICFRRRRATAMGRTGAGPLCSDFRLCASDRHRPLGCGPHQSRVTHCRDEADLQPPAARLLAPAAELGHGADDGHMAGRVGGAARDGRVQARAGRARGPGKRYRRGHDEWCDGTTRLQDLALVSVSGRHGVAAGDLEIWTLQISNRGLQASGRARRDPGKALPLGVPAVCEPLVT